MSCQPYRLTQKTAIFDAIDYEENSNMKPKNTICLWFDKDAQEAARFYAATFPDSKVTAVHNAPADYPSGKKAMCSRWSSPSWAFPVWV